MAKARHSSSRSKRKKKGTHKARERERVLVVQPDAALGPEDGASEGMDLERES